MKLQPHELPHVAVPEVERELPRRPTASYHNYDDRVLPHVATPEPPAPERYERWDERRNKHWSGTRDLRE